MILKPLEADTRFLINKSLENLGWNFDGLGKNVYQEQPRTELERFKLKGKRPDYVLYSKEDDKNPIMIIEAKKKGERIDTALEQGIRYAKQLDAPIVFATDGLFCKSYHTKFDKTPLLNGDEVDEFLREALALKYLNSWEVNTISPKVQYSRKELISIFDEANNMLRGDGLRAGIERFGEFANILFLKLISESEDIKKLRGDKSHFDDMCHWDYIKNLKANSRIEHINKIVFDKLNNLFETDIFTPLTIRDTSILKDIMDKLDPLTLTDVDSDVKGDAFEYFLKESTASGNDLGEYFTPRHIVKAMVKLTNPQIGEKVYDPFCGTGGFLIESFHHIWNTMPRNEITEKMLRKETIYGNEITNTARITKMNMILAGDGHSGIKMKDSLANPINGEYDVVLANMPYSQKTKYGNLYDLPTTNGDSVCVQHCMKAISSTADNGRMAIVVPEGFLFRKDLAKSRELLLKNCNLQSIISLPQGVFLPYTGVKTNIIYATKINQKLKTKEKRKDYWYFDVKSDGYSLDNHRKRIDSHNDLDTYQEYRKLDNDQTEEMLEIGFEIIPLDKVKENDYILVGTRYREASNISFKHSSKYLSEVSTFTRGIAFPKTDQKTSETIDTLKVVTTKAAQSHGINDNDIIHVDRKHLRNDKLLQKNDILISLANSINIVGRVTYIDQVKEEKTFGAFMGLIRANSTKILPKLLFYMLRSDAARSYFLANAKTTTNISNITFEDLGNLILPIPPMKIQEQIIDELNEYQHVVDGARMIIESYKPTINIKNDWIKAKLPEVAMINQKSINPSAFYGVKEFTYIDISSVENRTGKINLNKSIVGNMAPSRAKRCFNKGDILMSTVRPNLQAFAYADFDTSNSIASTGFAVLSPYKINGKFLYYLLFNEFISTQLENAMSKGMYPSINKSDLENLDILIPPVMAQNQIVAEIEAELKLIEPSRQIIEIFSKKINDRIEELFKS